MTDSDKELLTLAAKAAGLDFSFRRGIPCVWWQKDRHVAYHDALGWKIWNPLASNNEAFELMVKLGICPEPSHDQESVTTWATQSPDIYFDEPCVRDPESATRRAIVRAAAEIGKSMQYNLNYAEEQQ